MTNWPPNDPKGQQPPPQASYPPPGQQYYPPPPGQYPPQHHPHYYPAQPYQPQGHPISPGKPPTDKSVGAALVLTFFFGPLGLLYVSVLGAILMSLLTAVVAVVTLGLGAIPLWCICMVWGAISAGRKHSAFQVYLYHAGPNQRPW